MTVKKTEKGYQVDIRPQGRNGKRFRKLFKTRSEALAYEKHIVSKWAKAEEWQNKNDNRRMSELAKTWHESHGKQLKDGTKRLNKLEHLIKELGDPIASKFTTQDFSRFRIERLKSVSANTVNHDHAYLRSMFNELKRLGEWERPNPLAGVRRLKIDEPELTFLDKTQINTLLAELDKSSSNAGIIARVCLATGARWGEAATLKSTQIRHGKIHLTGTKSGKNRRIPISEKLQELIIEHLPFKDGQSTFKRTIDNLGWSLPKGQLTHILRHTFASHFMINGGNIITLQKILGHGSLAMTVRYSHLSPDHLTEVLELNPLESP